MVAKKTTSADAKQAALSMFQIEQNYLNLMQKIEMQDGALTEEDEEFFDLNGEQFEKKVDSMAYLVRKYKGEAESTKDEVDRIKERGAMFSRMSDKLKARIKEAMDVRQIKNFKSNLYTIYIADEAETLMFQENLNEEGDSLEANFKKILIEAIKDLYNDRFEDLDANNKPEDSFEDANVDLDGAGIENINPLETTAGMLNRELGSYCKITLTVNLTPKELRNLLVFIDDIHPSIEPYDSIEIKSIDFDKRAILEGVKSGTIKVPGLTIKKGNHLVIK